MYWNPPSGCSVSDDSSLISLSTVDSHDHAHRSIIVGSATSYPPGARLERVTASYCSHKKDSLYCTIIKYTLVQSGSIRMTADMSIHRLGR
jgi:hypothetical protein